MLKKRIFLLSLLIFIISCQKTEIIKPVDKKAIADSAINQYKRKLYTTQIDSVFKKYTFNGSIAVLKIQFKFIERIMVFLILKPKTNRQSNDFRNRFCKQTIYLCFDFIENGRRKLNLEDQASKYLKDFQSKEFENIIIHQLLNHTSGLNNFGEKLLFKSGNGFNYSNDGFNALGKIIEEVSGKSYDENVMDLFKKVGMKNSSTGNLFESENFAGAYLGNEKNFEKNRQYAQKISQQRNRNRRWRNSFNNRDLRLWNNSLYSGKVIQPETLKNS